MKGKLGGSRAWHWLLLLFIEQQIKKLLLGKKKSDGSGWLFWWEEMDAKSERPENLLITGKKNFRNFTVGLPGLVVLMGNLGRLWRMYPHALVEVLVDTGKIEVLCVDPDAKVKWVKSEVRQHIPNKFESYNFFYAERQPSSSKCCCWHIRHEISSICWPRRMLCFWG